MPRRDCYPTSSHIQFISPVKHLKNATGYIHINSQTPAQNIKIIVETYERLTCWYGILNSEADIVSPV